MKPSDPSNLAPSSQQTPALKLFQGDRLLAVILAAIGAIGISISVNSKHWSLLTLDDNQGESIGSLIPKDHGVRYRQGRSPTWIDLENNRRALSAGDVIFTSQNTSATMEFHSGGQAEIGPSSLVVVENPTATATKKTWLGSLIKLTAQATQQAPEAPILKIKKGAVQVKVKANSAPIQIETGGKRLKIASQDKDSSLKIDFDPKRKNAIQFTQDKGAAPIKVVAVAKTIPLPQPAAPPPPRANEAPSSNKPDKGKELAQTPKAAPPEESIVVIEAGKTTALALPEAPFKNNLPQSPSASAPAEPQAPVPDDADTALLEELEESPPLAPQTPTASAQDKRQNNEKSGGATATNEASGVSNSAAPKADVKADNVKTAAAASPVRALPSLFSKGTSSVAANTSLPALSKSAALPLTLPMMLPIQTAPPPQTQAKANTSEPPTKASQPVLPSLLSAPTGASPAAMTGAVPPSQPIPPVTANPPASTASTSKVQTPSATAASTKDKDSTLAARKAPVQRGAGASSDLTASSARKPAQANPTVLAIELLPIKDLSSDMPGAADSTDEKTDGGSAGSNHPLIPLGPLGQAEQQGGQGGAQESDYVLVQLNWKAAPNAKGGYTIEFANRSGTVVHSLRTPGNQVAALLSSLQQAVQQGIKYRVVSTTADNLRLESRWNALQVDLLPPRLSQPVRGSKEAKGKPLIMTWTRGGGSAYQIQLSRAPDFSSPIADENVEENLWVFETSADSVPAGTYHWRVRRVIEVQGSNPIQSSWSKPETFTLETK